MRPSQTYSSSTTPHRDGTADRFSGYSFLIELKYRAHRHGLRLCEMPIVFADRQFGQSRITRGEILGSVRAVWALRRARNA